MAGCVRRYKKKSLRAVDDSIPERYPNRMIADLSDALADTSAVAVDVGQHMVWSYQSFHNQKDQKLLFSGGHGAMGYALPAAIGAYYATGKPVACICGDGAFQMNIQELEWVKRENLPITMMVMNNHALGMIRHLQRDYFESRSMLIPQKAAASRPATRRGSQKLMESAKCLYGSQ